MKKLFLFALPVVALAALWFLIRTPDTDPEEMLAKYANAASRFAEDETGLKVHYRDQGNPDGVPIVLIHGTAASLHTWAPLVRRLGDQYRVITYTQPGHGLTGPHPRDDYAFAGMAEALDLVTEKLGLDRFVLGGNSMGGWVAWRYALANPEKVEALILLDAAGAPLRDGEEKPPGNLAFRLLDNPVGRFVLSAILPRALVEKSALQTVSVKSVMDAETVDRYWELARYPGNRRAARLRADVDREPEKFKEIGAVAAPTLIIWGAEGQLIYASAAKTFEESMANAEAVIYDGVGHLPMEEAPDRTAEDIDAFLDRVLNNEETAP